MSDNGRPRVLLVDDNETILERSSVVLSRGCTVVGTLSDGRAAIEAIDTLNPDVLVLDNSMPQMGGLAVVARLRRAGSTVPIRFLTVHEGAEFVRAATQAGGVGYVVKPRLVSDLTTAVLAAFAGESYVSQMAY